MAELHRGTRRYDLHLSGPQVIGIVIGSLVTLGVAFGIGVGFGRRLATVEPPRVGPDPSSAKLPAPEPTTTHDSFTYQNELTKSDPPPPPLKPEPPPAAPKPVVAVAPPPVVSAADAGTPSVVIGTPHAITAATATAAEPPEEKAPAPTEKKPSLPEEKRPAAAAEKKPAPAEEKKPAATDVADKFTVQFVATASQADADKLAKQLKAAGYAPAVVVADVPGKGHVYRVRAGHFATREAAESFREQAHSKHKFSGMVMPSH